jgi:acyl carrier protein phosphodiesterase
MNFLCHMLLSGSDDQLLVGNFMGDFVKGRLDERFPPRIREGVQLHRRIDSFAEQHPLFRQSRLRLDPSFGRYRGVLVDLFYDYFLANDWDAWSAEPFASWLDRTRRVVEAHRRDLPAELQRLVPVIFDDLLPSYQTIAGIEIALGRLSRRISRENPLADGATELRRHHDGLRADFRAFMPAIIGHVAAMS